MDNLFKTVKRFAASTLSVITLMSAGATPVNTLATEAGLNMPSIVTTVNAADSVTYFRKYTGSSNSIVDIMKWYGVDSSYSYRKSIAILNGISNYSGTASQNSQMVRLAKSGTLIRSRTSGGSGGGGSSSAVNYTKFTNDARWRVGKTWNSSQKPLIGAQGYSGCVERIHLQFNRINQSWRCHQDAQEGNNKPALDHCRREIQRWHIEGS